jgi:hypothetical protein
MAWRCDPPDAGVRIDGQNTRNATRVAAAALTDGEGLTYELD